MLQPLQMHPIERASAADRKANAMHRQRVVCANPVQEVMRRTARAHVILGVDLEEIDSVETGKDIPGMLGLKTGTSERRRIQTRK
jgi:hypothetical protein